MRYLTLGEVAEITRAPMSTVYHWCGAEKLRSFRVGKRRLVREDDLAKFIERGAA